MGFELKLKKKKTSKTEEVPQKKLKASKKTEPEPEEKKARPGRGPNTTPSIFMKTVKSELSSGSSGLTVSFEYNNKSGVRKKGVLTLAFDKGKVVVKEIKGV